MDSVLPEGWESRAFEDSIDKVTYTKKIKRKEFLNHGLYPIISQEMKYINGYWDSSDDLFDVDKPIIIFGDHTQVLKYIDFSFVLGADGVKILKPIKDIDSKYFYYYLQNINLGTLGYARHYRLLKEQNINYPKPLQEQEKIVATLDEAFSAIDKAKANAELNLQNAKVLFESYLQGVFENRGEGWEEKNLGEMADFRNGINFTKNSKGKEIKIVGVKNFQKHFFIPLENLESVTMDGNLNENDILKNNDILAVRSNGNPKLIGRTILAKNITQLMSHSGFTIRIRLTSSVLSGIYLCHYLKTQKTRDELVKSGNGVGIKSLNQGSLSSLLIPLPPLQEQEKIVKKLNAIQEETKKLEAIYTQKIGYLDELKKAILQKAFSGELR